MYAAQGRADRNRTPVDDATQRPIGQVPPHKERALGNFLTWSFFLAQILAADQLVAGQAKAAGDLDLPTSDARVEAATLPADDAMPAEGMGNSNAEEGGAVRSSSPAEDGVAALMKTGQIDGSPDTLDAIGTVEWEESTQGEVLSGNHALAASASVPDDVTSGIANDIQGEALDAVEDAVVSLPDTVETIIGSLDDILGAVTDPLLGTLGDVVPDVVASLGNGLGDVVEGTLDPLLDTAETVVGTLDDVLEVVTDPLLGTLSDVVPDALAGLGDGLGDAVEGTLDPLLDTAETVVGSLDDILGAVTDPLLGTLSDVVPDALASLGDGLGDVVEGTLDPLLDTAEAAVGALDDVVPNLFASLGDAIDDAVQALSAALEDGSAPLVPAFEAAEGASDALDDVFASAGELTFPVLEIVRLDYLYSGGRYTDYNLALQGENPSVEESSDASSSSSNPLADVLAALSGSDDGEPLDNLDHGLHVPHSAIPGFLDGFGLRGLGDAFV